MINNSLIQHYKNLRAQMSPANQFIKELAELTHRKPGTVKMWLCGSQSPDLLTREVIAKHLGADVDILFPNVNGEEGKPC